MEYKIETSLLNKIFTILNTDNYFNSNNYNISITYEEAKKFSTKIKRPEPSIRELIIKYPSLNNDKQFYTLLENYLKEEYTFDLWLYGFKNNISLISSYSLFSILHEFGHVIEYINRINNGGDYLNRDEMIELSKYWEVSRIEDINKRFYEYRKIDKEMIADKNAIELMKKYNKEFSMIM